MVLTKMSCAAHGDMLARGNSSHSGYIRNHVFGLEVLDRTQTDNRSHLITSFHIRQLAYPIAIMKASTIFSIAVAAQGATAAPMTDSTTAVGRELKRLDLREPFNWMAVGTLFPRAVMQGFHANESEYNAESWAQYVVDECKSKAGCKSTTSFSAINSGSTGGRYWFGYTFDKPATTFDYVRNPDERFGVQHSAAYSI
ncbi:hypothetical protein CDD82_1896 [Ophiocordyceps australis]|uniref:Uncharacterized protein n=1 Tax=Ophiocordyceps australis TaxID=1399860 RepID=A0A2C5ZGT8_9HYPO|nr:hypothetical protein CDD82_1896 [Ophiocordyceps australis]